MRRNELRVTTRSRIKRIWVTCTCGSIVDSATWSEHMKKGKHLKHVRGTKPVLAPRRTKEEEPVAA